MSHKVGCRQCAIMPNIIFETTHLIRNAVVIEAHHDSNENGTDGVRDHPVERVNQECRDDYSYAAQGIGQNVQKDLKIIITF